MINAQTVKELRDKTGAGVMDCKKALIETNGDMDRALGIIQKKGFTAAAKKADRITTEGIVEIFIPDDNKKAGMIEFNCETDFVAANKEFATMAKNLAKQASLTDSQSIGEFIEEKYIADEGISVKNAVASLIARLGENMSLRRFEKFTSMNGVIKTYIHGNGRIGVIVELECDNKGPVLLEIGKDIAMQIAAANPLFMSTKDVDQDTINKKRESFRIGALNEGKPEKVVDKIVEGKIQKYLKEVCLLEQVWIKDPDYTIEKYLKEKSKEIGEPILIKRYARFERGEVMGQS